MNYTPSALKDVVSYASARGVRVIPCGPLICALLVARLKVRRCTQGAGPAGAQRRAPARRAGALHELFGAQETPRPNHGALLRLSRQHRIRALCHLSRCLPSCGRRRSRYDLLDGEPRRGGLDEAQGPQCDGCARLLPDASAGDYHKARQGCDVLVSPSSSSSLASCGADASEYLRSGTSSGRPIFRRSTPRLRRYEAPRLTRC